MDRRFDDTVEGDVGAGGGLPRADRGLLSRLETFVQPFAASLREPEQHRHTVEYMTGLLSKLEHKTGEGIAYLHDQERRASRSSSARSPGTMRPCSRRWPTQVGEDLGEPDGVIVFDPSAFAKKGTKSVGVARQWCGRLGKVENCQVGIYMAYASREGTCAGQYTSLSPRRNGRRTGARRKAAGVPKGIKFRTRHELALEMLDEHGAAVAARLGRRRRRDGPSREFSPGIAGPWRALPAGGALEHADPRPRRAAAGILGARAASQEPVHAAWIAGARRCRRPPGRRSRSATARRGRWWSRS